MKSKFNHHRPLHYVLWGVGGLAIAAVGAFFFGFILMLLWNWLMPMIFGLPNITFWQGWGLVLLTHILFKSGPHNYSHDKHHHGDFKEKFNEHLKTHLPHNSEENPETVAG
ncbi:MAG: hypothetical protein V1681_11200 [Candidatus Neomarinimicrobiota bacterium]